MVVGSKRTSMRLEPQMWEAMEFVARREGVTVNQLCTRIDQKRRGIGLTSATRIFLISYFRRLAAAADSAPVVVQGTVSRGVGEASTVSWVLDRVLGRQVGA